MEEVRLGEHFQAQPLADLNLQGREFVLLAVRQGQQWIFNPPGEHKLEPGNTLIVMASPVGVQALEALLNEQGG